MDSGLYAACTALMSRTQALDTVANNLANSNTQGFRATRTSFNSVLAGFGHKLHSKLNVVTNSYGLEGSSSLDMQPGVLQSTGNPLDVGIDGSGFLAVQTAHGVAYTRNGALQVSPQGVLTTAVGEPVLGTNGPITIPPSTTVQISSDGTITANGAIAGKLNIVEFAPGASPKSLGGSNYGVPANQVTASTTSQLRQGVVEQSNVNPISSVIQLIEAQRSVEGMRHALTMIDTDINKTAAQDIPRVS
jgi:flagellar basal-body rod protein FlgF/flagellar basal-body rod protein FlgG